MMSDWLDTILNDTANQTNQVKIIYNELVSDIAENFGQRMAEQMYLSEEEEYRGSEDVTTPNSWRQTAIKRTVSPRTVSPRTVNPRTVNPRSVNPRTVKRKWHGNPKT